MAVRGVPRASASEDELNICCLLRRASRRLACSCFCSVQILDNIRKEWEMGLEACLNSLIPVGTPDTKNTCTNNSCCRFLTWPAGRCFKERSTTAVLSSIEYVA